MNAVVTGASGFLGRHLVRMLREADDCVYEVSHRLNNGAMLDLREPNLARVVLSEAKIAMGSVDVVYHLAAKVSGIGHISQNPATYLYDNASMALNVIRAACEVRAGKVVMAGSVCSYPKQVPMPMVEENLWEGYPEPSNAPYGIAKRLALSYLQACHEQMDLPAAYLLSANLYGPGDDFDPRTSHVIPALIRKVHAAQQAGEDLVVWGTGRATRDFLFVDDAARAYMAAGARVCEPVPINIGSGEEISIAQLAGTIARIMDFDGRIVYDSSRPDGQPRRSLSIDRAAKVLDWRPITDLEVGLGVTIGWYLTHAKQT